MDCSRVTFSNGSIHSGIARIREAFESNFHKIKNEVYEMKNITWLRKEETFAVYIFEYFWSGLVDGKLISGNGIGTSVIVHEAESWKLLSEHLGKKTS